MTTWALLRTNNPRRQQGLEASGIEVLERREARTVHEPENPGYMRTKLAKLGHLMDWLMPGTPQSDELL